jgi:hypothetical protein
MIRCYVDWEIVTDVSRDCSAYIFRAEESTLLRLLDAED